MKTFKGSARGWFQADQLCRDMKENLDSEEGENLDSEGEEDSGLTHQAGRPPGRARVRGKGMGSDG